MTRSGSTRRPFAARLGLVIAPVLFGYTVLVGGTPTGELLGELRAINVAIGLGIVCWVLLGPRLRIDRVDIGVAIAIALFEISAMFSTAPRQSFDAGLSGLVYAAAFIGGRRLLWTPAARRMILQTMMAIAVVAIALMTWRVATTYAAWQDVTNWVGIPPIGLQVSPFPWGHRYDMALLGALTLPAWFAGNPSGTRRAAGAILAVAAGAAIFLVGSRTLWLACGAGIVALVLPAAYRGGRSYVRRRLGDNALISVALTITAVLAVAVIADRLFVTATVGQRLAMWLSSMQAWLARPFTGSGPGTFPWILQTTGYFDANSLAPRHPDSALFQLLPELGLVGIACLMVLFATSGMAILRSGRRPAISSVVVFIVASLGSNPTDFAFLIAVLIAWSALATPTQRVVTGPRLISRPLLAAVGIPIMVAVAATTAGGILYQRAWTAAGDGRFVEAAESLDAAIAFDPGMALYIRQRGTIEIAAGRPTSAIPYLSRATAINPSDDLAWRTQGIAYLQAGDLEAARTSIQRALELQRSDPTNLLLAAYADSTRQSATELIEQTVQAWPEVVLAPGWRDFAGQMSTPKILAAAGERWATSKQSPEPLTDQLFTIDLLLGDREAALVAAAEAGISRPISLAEIDSVSCARDATTEVQGLRPAPASPYYWRLFVQTNGIAADVKTRATDAYEILTARGLDLSRVDRFLNPLQENDLLGYSGDVWGYRRLPIAWPSVGVELPSPNEGRTRWITAMRAAIEAAGLTRTVGCSG